jgi:simple sugar transport system permease protein
VAEEIALVLVTGLLAAAIRLATPLLLAALGEIFAQRAGILNLGLEGMMLVGAFASFAGATFTGNLLVGLFLGIVTSTIMSLILGLWSITFKANMVHTGVLLTIVSQGLVGFLTRQIFGGNYIPSKYSFPFYEVPILSDIPVLGTVLFRQNILVYLALILVPIMYFILFKTPVGLKIRAVGENPKAADTLGVNVYATRYIALIIGGAMAGIAGASLSIGTTLPFTESIVSGRGWIAVALVYFGIWNPYLVLAGALLFGTVDSLQLRLQVTGSTIPPDVLLMLPYILTIVAVLFIATRKVSSPSALTVPYEREK